MSTVPSTSSKRNACPKCLAVFRQSFVRCPLDGAELQQVDQEPLIGETLADRYIIEECIGEGGMGQVYRAKHTRMSRRFAIKVLYGDLAADNVMRARFSREAEAASRLTHPNLVAVTDFGETAEGLLYLAMEFLDGPLLGNVILHEAPFDSDRTLALFRQMTAGLEHAHDQDLVHRDFKPTNVIVTDTADGEVAKILDFGIARLLEDTGAHTLTTQGALIGTPAFMAPEQASGEKVDQRTDLFSLGIVLYQMASGRLPFDGDPMAVLRQNMVAEPPPMSIRVPGLSVDFRVESMALKLMAKDPAKRYQSAREVINAIDEWWVPPRARKASTSSGIQVAGQSNPQLRLRSLDHAPTLDASGAIETRSPSAALELTPAPALATTGSRKKRVALFGLVAAVCVALVLWGVTGSGDGEAKTSQPLASTETSPEPEEPTAVEMPPAMEAIEEGSGTLGSDLQGHTPDPDIAPVAGGTDTGERSSDRPARASGRRSGPALRAPVKPKEISREQFKNRYQTVYQKLQKLQDDYPDSAAIPGIQRDLGSIDPLNMGNPATRKKNYRLLGKLDAKIARAIRRAARKQ